MKAHITIYHGDDGSYPVGAHDDEESAINHAWGLASEIAEHIPEAEVTTTRTEGAATWIAIALGETELDHEWSVHEIEIQSRPKIWVSMTKEDGELISRFTIEDANELREGALESLLDDAQRILG